MAAFAAAISGADGASTFLIRGLCSSKPNLPADVRHLDLGQPWGLGRAQLRVAVLAHRPALRQEGGDLLVALAASQQLAEVVPNDPEQAGVQPSVRREAGAGAVATER